MAPAITSVRLMDYAGTMTVRLEAILVSYFGILIANRGMVSFRLTGIILPLKYVRTC